MCRSCGDGTRKERGVCKVVDGKRICTQCEVRPVKDRYTRCARCRGREYDECACGAQKTKRSDVCKECRWANPEFGADHGAWKGGRVQLKDGYIRAYAPEHPRAVNGRYVLEHILVMEEKLGRYLHPDERVHHMNKIRNDNRPENLELWSIGHPAGARVIDLLNWANEVIERYGDVCLLEKSA